MKSLKEICLELGVTRRAIQGYEDAGLVKATRKNKYGYLLYDEKAQERIQRIKFLQDVGFSIKEIKSLIDAPKELLRERLEERIKEYELEIAEGKKIIRRAKELIKELKEQEE